VPFTHEQFLDVFGRYNESLWLAVVSLWALSAATTLWLVRRGRRASPLVSLLISVQWAWSGIVYHAAFFTSVNPAAWTFAAMFVIEGAFLLWAGVVRRRLEFEMSWTRRHLLGVAFILYALAYPGINLAPGYRWPRVPLFAVPCPTTLLTTGLLLTAVRPMPLGIAVIPVLWSLIGGSAAVLLKVPADFALVIGAAVLTIDIVLADVVRIVHARA
jgi:Family of unknown function (DUF6064)